RPPGGNEDHRQPRPQTPDLSQKLQSLLAPGAAGEVHVLNHQIEILLTQEAKSLLRRPGPASRVAVTLEEEAQRGDHRRVVVDEEDHGGIIRSAMPQPAAPGPPACSGRECRRKKSDTSSPWRTPNRSRRPGWRGLRSGREPESGPPGEPRGERPGWSPPTVPAGPGDARPCVKPQPPAADRSRGCAGGDSATALRSGRAQPSAAGRSSPFRPR